MLNQVPIGLRRAARNVTLRHPNAFDCQVYRNMVQRTAGTELGPMGGLPTMGGMGVMKADEEAEVDYVLLGNGKCLMAGIAEETSLSDDRGNAEAEAAIPVYAQVEPLTEGEFEVKQNDLVMIMPGGGVVITYEATKILSTVNIPPYVSKVELSALGDLMFPSGLAAVQAGKP